MRHDAQALVLCALLLPACGQKASSYRVSSNNVPADGVYGQPGFVTLNTGLDSALLNQPSGVAFVGPQLIVSDQGNSRYLVYNP